MKILIPFILLVFLNACSAPVSRFSPEIEAVLSKAGTNRVELEQALDYFAETGDTVKLQAVHFLIENMDIHCSETYYWKDATGAKVAFSEYDYPNLEAAVAAIDSIRAVRGDLFFQDTIIDDIKSITGQYLISNVNHAVDTWRMSKYKDISFDDFCEYVLPYRVTVEPLEDWRNSYQTRYQWVSDSLKHKPLKLVLTYLGIDYREWFTFTYGKETRNEPLSRLGAMQLLFREKGACEDIAALEAFILRSQAVPVAYDVVPLWGTSLGAHFMNAAFDGNVPIRFDVTTSQIVNHTLPREPAKVIRYTYSKQAGTLAMMEDEKNIPPCFLQTTNYFDVTQEYWETSDVNIPLFPEINPDAQPILDIVYACMFSHGEWNPIWWGEAKNDSVTFRNMPNGTVILPMRYKRGLLIPAGYPLVNGYNNKLLLRPDTLNKRTITIEEQDRYLIFRLDKRYKLFYWDTKWKLVEEKTATVTSDKLMFEQVPGNALMLLLPEYSEQKERPFIITNDNIRYWW